jgi:hypothetical protein
VFVLDHNEDDRGKEPQMQTNIQGWIHFLKCNIVELPSGGSIRV